MSLLRRDFPADPVRYRHAPPLIIRWAGPDDAQSLAALAEVDEATVPPAPLMLGFVDGKLWAAVSLATGAAICDPFKPSAAVARLLAERGRQLTVPEPRPRFGLVRRGQKSSRPALEARLGQGTL